MSRYRILVLILWAMTLAGCDGLLEPNDKGLIEIRLIEKRWTDGVELARSTAKIQLSPLVANLQAVKRDLDSLPVSKCLNLAKMAFGVHMSFTIDAFFLFMRDDKYSAQDKLEKAKVFLESYESYRDKCST